MRTVGLLEIVPSLERPMLEGVLDGWISCEDLDLGRTKFRAEFVSWKVRLELRTGISTSDRGTIGQVGGFAFT